LRVQIKRVAESVDAVDGVVQSLNARLLASNASFHVIEARRCFQPCRSAPLADFNQEACEARRKAAVLLIEAGPLE